jgi:preprotein translocase subunit SecG
MMIFPILAAGFFMVILRILFVICCVALVLIILIQKGRGGGLSGAFGGGMASNILGSKTGDFLTWVTIVFVAVFLFTAILLAKYDRPVVAAGPELPPDQTTMPAPPEQTPMAQPADMNDLMDTNIPVE